MTLLKRIPFTIFLVGFAILLSLVALGQELTKSYQQSTEIKLLHARVDSLGETIRKLSDTLVYQRSTEAAELEKRLLEQRREYLDLVSTLTGLSAASSGNILNSQEVIIGIIALLLVVFGGAGKFYVDNYLSKLDKKYEVQLSETRAQYFLGIGQFTVVRGILERIIELDKKNLFAHETLGYLYLGDILNNPEKAVYHNRLAIRLKPNSLFPYINLQIALDHAKYPLEDIERAFISVIERAKSLNADELTFGKAKLFFAGNLSSLASTRKAEAIQLVKESRVHFNKINDPSKNRWDDQAKGLLNNLQKQ